MASREDDDEQGYDRNRFIGPVKEDLICRICQDVLKAPRFCQDKEHPFCLACILRYLRDPKNCGCPTCREPLTPETLKRPQRFFLKSLSELKLSCDYNERGCPEIVHLENLEFHVSQCGFAPITCERCEIQINRREKENHEKSACQMGVAKSHDFSDIKAGKDRMKQELYQVKRNENQMKKTLDEMKENQDLIKRELNKVMNSQGELHTHLDATNSKLDATNTTLDATSTKLNGMGGHIAGIRRRQDETNDKVNKIEESIDEIKQTQVEMKQQFEKIGEILTQILQGNNVNNHGASALDPVVTGHPAINQDIIIIGGRCRTNSRGVSNTVEKFNVVERKSSQLPSMNQPRAHLASCVYNNDVIVVGGYDGEAATETIEILKMWQHPLAWKLLDGKLPVKLCDHAVVLYQDKLFIIGGFDWNEKAASNAIFEVRLLPPYTSKLLARMPQAIRFHSAEVVNDKLFIFGGTKTDYAQDAIDSVTLYDIVMNEFKPCALLPHAVVGTSTVTWGNMIIVVGGRNKNGQVLNDVIMYDTETGQSKILPSMIYKRNGCSAVIVNDVIVVMGGLNDEQGILKSVETYTIGSEGWKELPGMMERRQFATAVLIPGN